MNKYLFEDWLRNRLDDLPADELDRIVAFYLDAIDERMEDGMTEEEAEAEAAKWVAIPGTSEHQTGLAFDLNSLEQNFGETKEGIWLAEHCHEFGFIIRYPV